MYSALIAVMTAAILGGAQRDAAVVSMPQEGTESPTVLNDVEVRAGELQTRAENFVASVAAPPRNMTLGRWSEEVCIGVANATPGAAQYVIDRVSSLALDLGLRIGQPGCRADIMIVFADDASAVAQKLVRENPQGFRPPGVLATLSEPALEAFQVRERPVRWWNVSLPVEADTGNSPVVMTVGEHGSGFEVPILHVRSMSRLRSGLRNDLKRSVVIVDASRLNGRSLASVTDYVALVALAQVNPDVDVTGQDSILTLFDKRSAADRLTEWDMSYLRALYSVDRDRRNPSHEQREIGREMVLSYAGR